MDPRALVASVLVVLASGACKPTCAADADCQGNDELCSDVGFCEPRKHYACDGDQLVVTAAGEEVERDACATFFARCVVADDGTAACVRPNGGQACKHILEDCQIALFVNGTELNEIGCADTMNALNPCVQGCMGIVACDVNASNACLRERDDCADPPAPDAGPAAP